MTSATQPEKSAASSSSVLTKFNLDECRQYHSEGWTKLWKSKDKVSEESATVHQTTSPAWGTPAKRGNTMQGGQNFLTALLQAVSTPGQ